MDMVLVTSSVVLLLILSMFVLVYVCFCCFLDTFNVLKYGRHSYLVWVPFVNFYMMGKLAFNELVGGLLLICSAGYVVFNIGCNSIVNPDYFFFDSFTYYYSLLYYFMLFIMFICSLIKYNNILTIKECERIMKGEKTAVKKTTKKKLDK